MPIPAWAAVDNPDFPAAAALSDEVDVALAEAEVAVDLDSEVGSADADSVLCTYDVSQSCESIDTFSSYLGLGGLSGLGVSGSWRRRCRRLLSGFDDGC